jgi:hypothetical protein
MTGCITAGKTYREYYLQIDGEKKPRRIFWADNQMASYVKFKKNKVRVHFNEYLLQPYTNVTSLPVRLNAAGRWEMVHEYKLIPSTGLTIKFEILPIESELKPS